MSGGRRLLTLLREDARIWRQDLLLNRMLSSGLLPRMGRLLVMRALGLRVYGVMGPGSTITGPIRNLSIGPRSGVHRGCFIDLSAPVSIGSGSAIAMGVKLVTSDHPIDEHGRWSEVTRPQPISIGDRVWIGANVVVCPGAVIESDVVVAAGAVVIGRLESGAIYGGIPARRLGSKVISGSFGPDQDQAFA